MSASYIFKEFNPRCGSTPIVRFILGIFAMIGALIFLGCPWRAILRLAGGDLNALTGLAGLAAGIYIGILFLKNGYNLGRSKPTYIAAGWLFPLVLTGFLIIMLIDSGRFGKNETDILFYSLNGPGAMHAPIAISLIASLCIGFLAQRSRFCTMGALRDLILFGQTHLLSGFIALMFCALITNLFLNQFNLGFTDQPIAHTLHLWNFLGMTLAGLAFTLAGGCPGRQLFLAGEGDTDASIFILGMIAGAGIAHNFGLASSPNGIGPHSIAAVIIGFIACSFIGFTMRKKITT